MTEFVYSQASRAKLMTCNSKLQAIASRALELSPVDIIIIHGWRGKDEQNKLVREGKSKTPWPTSKHNTSDANGPCSSAIDFAPVSNGRIQWGDTHMFAVVAGCMFSAAKERGVEIRWGGDWDMDGSTTDQTFMDWGHVELVE